MSIAMTSIAMTPRSRAERHGPWRRHAAVLAALTLGLAGIPAAAQAAPGDPGLVDLARTSSASASLEEAGNPVGAAIDGNASTRWATGQPADVDSAVWDQWYQLDLGTISDLDSLKIAWEYSYAVDYTIEVSDTTSAWTTASTVTGSDGDEDVVTLPAGTAGRYLRVHATQMRPNYWEANPHYYGYSFYSLEAWGVASQGLAQFDQSSTSGVLGSTVSVPIRTNKIFAGDTSVKVTSVDGTAVAGTDYTAVSQTITIPAGSTTASVDVTTLDSGRAPGDYGLSLALSDPSSGLLLGSRTTTDVTLTSVPATLPAAGDWTSFIDFEDGNVPGYNYGDGEENKPALTVIDAARPGSAGSKSLSAQMSTGTSWGGYFYDFPESKNWKKFDAFRFWFKGTASGKTLTYQLKSGGVTYETDYVDDSSDWKAVEIAFSDLRNKDDATDRFDKTSVSGYAFGMNGFGSGQLLFDDFQVREFAGDIESFDHSPVLTEQSDPVGIYSWGQSESDEPTTTLTLDDRNGAAEAANTVLGGSYQIASGGWGGVTQNFAEAQNWGAYQGIRFWWYASQDSNPASPTAGPDITVEVRTGRTSGTTAALYQATFKDNWGSSSSRWKLVEIPFSSFTARTDYQQDWTDVPAAPVLGKAWGWSLTFPAGTAQTGWKVDEIQAYGVASSPDDIVVSVDPGISLVDAGGSAEVAITATSDDGSPLAQEVTVTYTTSGGSAVAGTDYTTSAGSVTFPQGEESGSTQSFVVQTAASTAASVSKDIGIKLTSTAGEVAGDGKVVINAHDLPYLDDSLSNEARAADLLSRMTLDEKVGQMAQAERLGLGADSIASLGLGSVLSGGGSVPADNTPSGWADMVDGFQTQALSTRLQIPLIYGVDAVHGHNNVVGATILPHNIGLGATRDPDLVERAGQVTATEVRATGIPWTFSPCLCVTRDERWGRSYEAFSEDPALVSLLAEPAVVGLQGQDASDMSSADEVLATAKHWAGDGGTAYGSGSGGYQLDQGITKVGDAAELRRLFIDPYQPAIDAGVGSIMPSYSAVQIGEGPIVRMHENTELNTTVLKGELGFDGFLISDWEGVDKLAGSTYADKVARSVNSGMDMVMAPYNYAAFIQAVKDGVSGSVIPQTRVDDAVSRILVQKFALGLFDQPFADRTNTAAVGSAENRTVARQAAAESQVLLKNEDDTLPLTASETVYVAGSSADDLGRQLGGWSISWQGGTGDITTGTTIGDALVAASPGKVTLGTGTAAPTSNYDVGVVVVGEKAYAEGVGDVGNPASPTISLELSATDKATIDNVRTKVDKLVVLVVSGRPQVVTDQLGTIDALVASWLPGTEGEGVADVVFGKEPFTGRLPVTWPASSSQVPINVGDADYTPAYPYGWGLRTDAPRARLQSLLGELAAPVRAQAQVLLDAPVWASDGSIDDSAVALPLLQKIAALLSDSARWSQADVIVTLARDLVQGSATPSAAQLAAIADSEHTLVSGDAAAAVRGLAAAVGVTLSPSDDVPSADATASDLKVNGVPVAGFAPGTTSYAVRLPAGSSVPVVTATPAQVAGSVVVTPASSLPGTTTVVVTAPNGTTTTTYSVSFTLQPGSAAVPFTRSGSVAVTGSARLGGSLTAKLTGAAPAPAVVTYVWLRDGSPIASATSATYKPTKGDVGKRIQVRATLHKTGYVDAKVTSSARTIAKATSRTKIKVTTKKVKGAQRIVVRVTVKSVVSKPTGTVRLTYGKKAVKVKLKASKKGRVTVTLPKATRGTYKIKAKYRGSATVARSASKAKTVRVR